MLGSHAEKIRETKYALSGLWDLAYSTHFKLAADGSWRGKARPYFLLGAGNQKLKRIDAMSMATTGFRTCSEKRLILHALVAAGLIFLVLVTGIALHSSSCKFHKGSFSADFSRDFDISFTECRNSALKGLVLEIDSAFPYVSLRWE